LSNNSVFPIFSEKAVFHLSSLSYKLCYFGCNFFCLSLSTRCCGMHFGVGNGKCTFWLPLSSFVLLYSLPSFCPSFCLCISLHVLCILICVSSGFLFMLFFYFCLSIFSCFVSVFFSNYSLSWGSNTCDP
jgi:hypothetical protein